jgi:hypothetical protein
MNSSNDILEAIYNSKSCFIGTMNLRLSQIDKIMKELDRNRDNILAYVDAKMVEATKQEGSVDFHAYASYCPKRESFKFYELAYDKERQAQVVTVKKYYLTMQEACFELMQVVVFKNYNLI